MAKKKRSMADRNVEDSKTTATNSPPTKNTRPTEQDSINKALETVNRSTAALSPFDKANNPLIVVTDALLEVVKLQQNLIVNLITAVEKLCKKIDAPSSQAMQMEFENPPQMSSPPPALWYHEYKRQHEVVLAGLPEPISESLPARAREDFNSVCKILDSCGIEGQPSVVYRLGKLNVDNGKKPRLLKIQFPQRI